MNQTIVFTLLLAIFAASPQEKSATKKAPSQAATAAAFGKQTYLEYCAVCHGPDGRGTGPAASALKDPPADLTTLANTSLESCASVSPSRLTAHLVCLSGALSLVGPKMVMKPLCGVASKIYASFWQLFRKENLK
jgi:hypothetical protein